MGDHNGYGLHHYAMEISRTCTPTLNKTCMIVVGVTEMTPSHHGKGAQPSKASAVRS